MFRRGKISCWNLSLMLFAAMIASLIVNAPVANAQTTPAPAVQPSMKRLAERP
ncbi:MAG: hypothetical protein JO011_08320, partial [Ktedonobacteraceae bacterium]|nr:hypothetical protein [Ktedonobacteraceae bacterium]